MGEGPGEKSGEGPGESNTGGESELLKIDFSTFVLSLSTSALYQMGIVPGPGGSGVEEPDKLLARHTIDTLEMLQQKSRGNLEEEEEKLIESLLYELRMHFVKIGD
jgi:hypothetical protein